MCRAVSRNDTTWLSAPLDAPDLERRLAAEDALAALAAMQGPFFDAQRGGAVARVAKRLANLVMRPFARPQRWMNEAIREALRLELAATQAIERDVAATAAALARCERRVAALEERAGVDRQT
jgi:hypothetical protein